MARKRPNAPHDNHEGERPPAAKPKRKRSPNGETAFDRFIYVHVQRPGCPDCGCQKFEPVRAERDEGGSLQKKICTNCGARLSIVVTYEVIQESD